MMRHLNYSLLKIMGGHTLLLITALILQAGIIAAYVQFVRHLHSDKMLTLRKCINKS